MQKFIDWVQENARPIWVVGVAIALVGEFISAINKRQDTRDEDRDGDIEEEVDIVGDTMSETFKGAERWIQFLVFGCICAVLCHLAEWRIRDPIVQIEKAENVTVESDPS